MFGSKDKSAERVAELEKENTLLKTALTDLKTEKDEIEIAAAQEILQLSEQLNSATSNAESIRPVIHYQGDDYIIIGKKWNISGKTITVDQLRADTELFASLLAKKAGFIRLKRK